MAFGFLMSTAYISGDSFTHFSDQQMQAIVDAAPVVVALVAPALSFMGALTLVGLIRRYGWYVAVSAAILAIGSIAYAVFHADVAILTASL